MDDVYKWPVFRHRNIKRNSVQVALSRFVKMGICCSPGFDTSGRRLYRVKNPEWAIAYIEGDDEKPWLRLTPTPPTEGFLETNEHRDHFDVRLSKESFDRIENKAEVSNNQYTLRKKTFTLSVNGKSLAGQLFVRPFW